MLGVVDFYFGEALLSGSFVERGGVEHEGELREVTKVDSRGLFPQEGDVSNVERAAFAGMLILPILVSVVSPVVDPLTVPERYIFQHELVQREIRFKLRHGGGAHRC